MAPNPAIGPMSRWQRLRRRQRFPDSANNWWILALCEAIALSFVVDGVIVWANNTASSPSVLLMTLDSAVQYGATLLLPAAVAVAWLFRTVWRRSR
jgi:membrane protein implicated in regulation of membrane protease activity